MRPKGWILILSLLFLLNSCSKKQDSRGIHLNLNISPSIITDFLYVKMDYEFTTDEQFTDLQKDYSIYVHLWRIGRKEMLLQDDHIPMPATKNWRKGETIKYSRTLFIPQFLNEFDIDFEGYEEIKLSIGLYNPQAWQEKIDLFEKKIQIQPASINSPEIIYGDGWNDYETDIQAKDPFFRSWRWTTQKAVCNIENPKKISTLIIKGGINKNIFQDQKVTFKINNTLLEEFIPAEITFSKEYTITPEMTGENDEFTLQIETDKTFVPSKIDSKNKDNRELGIQIFFIYFREKVQSS